jgi:predicted nucleotidyltransferase component of viral defense system
MTRKPVNLPASVMGRLQNIAREKQTNPQLILRRYALERLLYRLSMSAHRDRFVLKGAMLFAAWLDDPFRATQDLDLLGFGDPAAGAIAETFRAICAQAVEDDGLIFDVENLEAAPIREGQAYGGIRVRTTAFVGRTRIPVQIDIGFGDVITPAAAEIAFPPLLDAPAPLLRTYPRETVVAEKLHAIVTLGQANSRMKDFYDLLALARLFAFEGPLLSEAIRATFNRRATEVPAETPVGLSQAFADDQQKMAQWTAFTSREPLLFATGGLGTVITHLRDFLTLPMQAAHTGEAFLQNWEPGGPWQLLSGEQ